MEQELKLRLYDPQAWEALLSHPLLSLGKRRARKMDAIYYDSADGRLRRARLAYRVRREGGRWVATVKGEGNAQGGLHERPEWNVTVPTPHPDISPFLDSPVGPALSTALDRSPLLPVLETHFDRRERLVTADEGSRIAAAADRGEIVAGEKRAPILELELELVSGDAAAILELGSRLCQSLPLVPDPFSKMHRGLKLAGLLDPSPSPNKESPLRGGDDAAAAMTRLLTIRVQETLHALNDALNQPDPAESLHSLRKRVRALRTLLRFSGPLDGSGDLAAFRQGLRDWFRQSSVRRDLDVQAAFWEQLRTELPEPHAPSSPLSAFLAASAGQGFAAESQAGGLAATLLRLWAWLARKGLEGEGDGLRTFVEHELGHWDGAAQRAGRHWQGLNAQERHALRIQVKNLRYALEAFLPLWPRQDAKALAKALKGLQDCLGTVHDRDVAPILLAPALESGDRALCREAGMLLGWHLGTKRESERRLGKAWKRYVEASRPWA